MDSSKVKRDWFAMLLVLVSMARPVNGSSKYITTGALPEHWQLLSELNRPAWEHAIGITCLLSVVSASVALLSLAAIPRSRGVYFLLTAVAVLDMFVIGACNELPIYGLVLVWWVIVTLRKQEHTPTSV